MPFGKRLGRGGGTGLRSDGKFSIAINTMPGSVGVSKRGLASGDDPVRRAPSRGSSPCGGASRTHTSSPSTSHQTGVPPSLHRAIRMGRNLIRYSGGENSTARVDHGAARSDVHRPLVGGFLTVHHVHGDDEPARHAQLGAGLRTGEGSAGYGSVRELEGP